jgi:hypothetical protein
VTCQDGLIPSSRNLENLAFLFTCRQIYEEAHLLAYSVTFSITNRWHRTDLENLQAHFASLPRSYECPIKNLELAAQWRKHHVDAKGKLHFLDSATEYTRFVWDVIELFPTVKKITITHSKLFAFTLFNVLCLDVQHDKMCWKVGTNGSDWKPPVSLGKIFLSSETVKGKRKVELECRDLPGVALLSPWPGWYPSTF